MVLAVIAWKDSHSNFLKIRVNTDFIEGRMQSQNDAFDAQFVDH